MAPLQAGAALFPAAAIRGDPGILLTAGRYGLGLLQAGLVANKLTGPFSGEAVAPATTQQSARPARAGRETIREWRRPRPALPRLSSRAATLRGRAERPRCPLLSKPRFSGRPWLVPLSPSAAVVDQVVTDPWLRGFLDLECFILSGMTAKDTICAGKHLPFRSPADSASLLTLSLSSRRTQHPRPGAAPHSHVSGMGRRLRRNSRPCPVPDAQRAGFGGPGHATSPSAKPRRGHCWVPGSPSVARWLPSIRRLPCLHCSWLRALSPSASARARHRRTLPHSVPQKWPTCSSSATADTAQSTSRSAEARQSWTRSCGVGGTPPHTPARTAHALPVVPTLASPRILHPRCGLITGHCRRGAALPCCLLAPQGCWWRCHPPGWAVKLPSLPLCTAAAGIQKHGGRVLLRSHVEEVVVEGGRAAGVRLRGGRAPGGRPEVIRAAKAVVSNASVWDTQRLLPAGEALSYDGTAVPWYQRCSTSPSTTPSPAKAARQGSTLRGGGREPAGAGGPAARPPPRGLPLHPVPPLTHPRPPSCHQPFPTPNPIPSTNTTPHHTTRRCSSRRLPAAEPGHPAHGLVCAPAPGHRWGGAAQRAGDAPPGGQPLERL